MLPITPKRTSPPVGFEPTSPATYVVLLHTPLHVFLVHRHVLLDSGVVNPEVALLQRAFGNEAQAIRVARHEPDFECVPVHHRPPKKLEKMPRKFKEYLGIPFRGLFRMTSLSRGHGLVEIPYTILYYERSRTILV